MLTILKILNSLRSDISRYMTYIMMLCLCVFFSCRQIEKSYRDTINPQPEKDYEQHNIIDERSSSSFHEERDNNNFFDDAEALNEIQNKLLNLPQFKGKHLNVYRSETFYNYNGGLIMLSVQNPDTTDNIDQYTYENGVWEMPTPVKRIAGTEKEVDFLVPISKVKFATVKRIVDTAKEKMAAIPGARIDDFIYFNYLKIKRLNNVTSGWTIGIKSSRSDYQLQFDIDGNFIKMNKI